MRLIGLAAGLHRYLRDRQKSTLFLALASLGAGFSVLIEQSPKLLVLTGTFVGLCLSLAMGWSIAFESGARAGKEPKRATVY